ncbi:50S ribosomal protein L4 [endosymbiont DhMRE of Dentiscutata heterogama]|uniref:50S ribosomal protein L4 n=1 Tax=endosymbiont DhMRE of Dentiscutata heterogama TaxID=1609546 RepID=UPI000629D48C|nr:50S ribosomal protein L4 [endosymbiont DhMRE of Dentiscutata heterogama]CFW93198.1 50S ribosomal protein L4 [endosymbiont DhMRE of Dentiscutata heterogama]
MEQIEVINHKGEIVSKQPLNNKIWKSQFSRWNISLANRYYTFNQHQKTHKTKTKGEVEGVDEKPHPQKGTGRARSGSPYNPQNRGGGITFGPTGQESRSLYINKKFKQSVFQSLLGEKMRKKEIIIVDKIAFANYKTKEAEKFLDFLPVKKTPILLVLSKEEENKEKIIYSFRNLSYAKISDSKLVNFSQVLSSNYLVFTHSAFSEIEKRLG